MGLRLPAVAIAMALLAIPSHSCSIACPRGLQISSLTLHAHGDDAPLLGLRVNDHGSEDATEWSCQPEVGSVLALFDFDGGALSVSSGSSLRPIGGLDSLPTLAQDFNVTFASSSTGLGAATVRGRFGQVIFPLPGLVEGSVPSWWHSTASDSIGMEHFYFYYSAHPSAVTAPVDSLAVCTTLPTPACEVTPVRSSYGAQMVDHSEGAQPMRVYDTLGVVALPLVCCLCLPYVYYKYDPSGVLTDIPGLNTILPHAVDTRAGAAVYTLQVLESYPLQHAFQRFDLVSGSTTFSRAIAEGELRSLFDMNASCPSNVPSPGAVCHLTSGTMCAYSPYCCESTDVCVDTAFATCEGGAWLLRMVNPLPCEPECASNSDCAEGLTCCNWDNALGRPTAGVCGEVCTLGGCPSLASVQTSCQLSPEQTQRRCSCRYIWARGCSNPTGTIVSCLTPALDVVLGPNGNRPF